MQEMNVQIKTLEKVQSRKRGFWWDAVSAWSKFNWHRPTSQEDIKHQYLWYNSNLDYLLFNKKLSGKGCNQIKDIIQNNQILGLKEFARKWDFHDFTYYYKIKKAIPKIWLKILNTQLVLPDTISGLQKLKKNRNTKYSRLSIKNYYPKSPGRTKLDINGNKS